MQIADLISYVRRDIGDPPEQFQTNVLSDGVTTWYNLPKMNLNPAGLSVQSIVNNTPTTLALTTDYTVDYDNGQIFLVNPLPNGAMLVVSGTCWAMFTDADLSTICYDSIRQHCFGQTITERIQDRFGFITYRDTPKGLYNLPRIEEPLISQLAIINTLWVMATEASLDVDIETAEGTRINRSQRYAQIMEQIQALTERYQTWCGELNVGAFRMETVNMRRVSYLTGRLVPIFRDREFDDHRWPVRELPQIDTRDEDKSGIPTPLWMSYGP